MLQLSEGSIEYAVDSKQLAAEEVYKEISFCAPIKNLQGIPPFVFVLAATIFEVAGDAIIRKCIYEHAGTVRILFLLGALLLFLYGTALNLAPVEFSQAVGLYIATLFVIWQVGNYIAFKTAPTLPILIGGTLIVIGGLLVTFCKTQDKRHSQFLFAIASL